MSANEFHSRVLDLIDVLVTIDPPADSPEGRLLRLLTAATENYERERYPMAPPTPKEAEAFRAEQIACEARASRRRNRV